MKITLSPQLRAAPVAVSVSGDEITIDGTAWDFGPLAEGDVLPREAADCPWLASDVTREGGHVCLMLILPHGMTAPREALFPEPIEVASDGPVALPPFQVAAQPEPAEETAP
ncbi:hypothetical protein [Paracoccus benzoatiresistens]|uniref:Uncharacterized protein n=1 Tax=Paracoccus benzoatiresistens TaxID=2997341 RepID=A0ABT4JBQ3_9RHOB|nr:hypothetical protein [Paracoccus sp. EF6]MCZ0963896.1 hypothetical protein [Paracoccus sp. EF6]